MKTLLVERHSDRPGLMTVTLNRPEKRNAVDAAMHRELQQVCRDLQDDHETRVVIITGAGTAFSSGADLTSVSGDKSRTVLEMRWRVSAGGRTAAALEELDQVTIAAINGLTIGGGVVVAVCCDLRVAAESAWFSIPEVALDMPMTWHSLPRLMRELGPARTKELVMAGERFSCHDALRWGLLNHVVSDAELMPRTLALADRLLVMHPMALAMTKSATNALARLMVPGEATYSDREQMLLMRQLARWDPRRSKTGDGAPPPDGSD